ncbi:MAG: hypothetical protein UF067_00275 [Paludibacteraceae bacterium]|nr:hypothetical protein [Paludibacteraceae bacterium]
MRFVIVFVSCFFAVVSCSRQRVESMPVTHDVMVADSVVEKMTVENRGRRDSVIRKLGDETVLYISDSFLLKNCDSGILDWKSIDDIARSLNDWEYSESAQYSTNTVESEDESGCSGDTMHVYRNGIKIMSYFRESCGDMGSYTYEYYYDNGLVGYKEEGGGQFGGWYSREYNSEAKYAKDGKLVQEFACSVSESPAGDDFIDGMPLKLDTIYESTLKRNGQEVNVRQFNDSLFYTIIDDDCKEMAKGCVGYGNKDLPKIVHEAMECCSSVFRTR